jgi:hypothetical protein
MINHKHAQQILIFFTRSSRSSFGHTWQTMPKPLTTLSIHPVLSWKPLAEPPDLLAAKTANRDLSLGHARRRAEMKCSPSGGEAIVS